jgi:hypothetical protein
MQNFLFPGVSCGHCYANYSMQHGQHTCFSSSLMWCIGWLECNQQQILALKILQLLTDSSAPSKVEFFCWHTFENQVILLPDIWMLELLVVSVMFHVSPIPKLNTIVMRLLYSHRGTPDASTTSLLLHGSLKTSVFTMMLRWFCQKIMRCFRTCFSSLPLLTVHAHSVIAAPFLLCTKEIQPLQC